MEKDIKEAKLSHDYYVLMAETGTFTVIILGPFKANLNGTFFPIDVFCLTCGNIGSTESLMFMDNHKTHSFIKGDILELRSAATFLYPKMPPMHFKVLKESSMYFFREEVFPNIKSLQAYFLPIYEALLSASPDLVRHKGKNMHIQVRDALDGKLRHTEEKTQTGCIYKVNSAYSSPSSSESGYLRTINI